MALQLADDGRDGVGREIATLGVEAVERVDEPDRADLDEVVQGLGPARIASGERPHEAEVLGHELLPCPCGRGARNDATKEVAPSLLDGK